MHLSTNNEYNFKVSSTELRLICKALGGRLKPEDIEPAKQLDREIATQKISIAEHVYNEAQKLKANLEKES